MLTKRIISCLDVKNFRTVKGVNFQNLKDAGDAIELAQFYSKNGADELVFLDIAATEEDRKTFVEFVSKVAQVLSIPFTVGGGISSIADMSKLFLAGADKISINSSAVKNPQLITEASKEFGSQAIAVSIDTKKITDNYWEVFIAGGKISTKKNALDWIQEVQELGAGELMITSMDCDGTKNGFDIEFLKKIKDFVHVPIIASGGAGTMDHFATVLEEDIADAALAASVFHFGEIEIKTLKNYLDNKGICMRLC